MFVVVSSIDYKGHVIQQRQFNSAGGGVAPEAGGVREVIPPVSVALLQWRIVKKKPDDQEEEVATAWSEEDAKRKVDELIGKLGRA